MENPVVFQPVGDSLSVSLWHAASKSQLLRNSNEPQNTLESVQAYAIRLLLFFPAITACAVLDIVWWVGKTITVYSIYRDGPKQHFSDLLKLIALPVITAVCALFNHLPPAQWTKLQHAVFYQDLVQIKSILAQGVDPNETSLASKLTPLEIAIFLGRDDIASLLLTTDKISLFAYNVGEAINCLFDAQTATTDPDPNEIQCRILIINQLLSKYTPSDDLHTRGDLNDALSRLLLHVKPDTPSYLSIVEQLLQKGANPNIKGLLASSLEDKYPVAVVDLLLKYGARIDEDTRNVAGSTGYPAPLHEAIKKIEFCTSILASEKFTSMVKSLQKQGEKAMIEQIGRVCSYWKTSAISLALMSPSPEPMNILRRHGVRMPFELTEDVISAALWMQELWDVYNAYYANDHFMEEDALRNKETERYARCSPLLANSYTSPSAYIASELLKERAEVRKIELKKVFDTFVSTLNMPPELIQIIAEH